MEFRADLKPYKTEKRHQKKDYNHFAVDIFVMQNVFENM